MMGVMTGKLLGTGRGMELAVGSAPYCFFSWVSGTCVFVLLLDAGCVSCYGRGFRYSGGSKLGTGWPSLLAKGPGEWP